MDQWRQEGEEALAGTCPVCALEAPGGDLEEKTAEEQGLPARFHGVTLSSGVSLLVIPAHAPT